MGKRGSGSRATPATVAVADAGVDHRLHTYEHDANASSYGAEAAEVLGVEPDRVLKTLVAEAAGVLVVGVVPVAASLDLKAIASAVGARRAVMADPAAAERRTGYVVGGISPLGQRQRLATVVDASVEQHDTVFVSGGRRGLEIELAPQDLIRLIGATVAAIARPGR